MAAQHNIMVTATPLRGVQGRADYISNPERQENLVAVHSSSADQDFWKALSMHCQEQAKYSQTKRACEGREFMVPLANELAAMDPDELAKMISDQFKELTGTENLVAIHWNKSMTNYHCHVITSENKEINQVSYGAELTRNTYYNAAGKRSTKKECLDQDGNLLPGCKFYEKGSRVETIHRFGSKIEELSSKSFLQTVKSKMVDFQNELLQESRFKVFDRSQIYLAEQHVGKNTTEEQKAAIRKKNAIVRAYNRSADELLNVAGEISADKQQGALGYLMSCRELIKKHGLSSDWIRAVHFQWKKMREKIEMLRKQLKSRDGMSIMDKLQSAQKEVQEQQRPKPEQKRKSPEWTR